MHITLSYTSYIYMEIPMNRAQKKGDPFSYLAVKKIPKTSVKILHTAIILLLQNRVCPNTVTDPTTVYLRTYVCSMRWCVKRLQEVLDHRAHMQFVLQLSDIPDPRKPVLVQQNKVRSVSLYNVDDIKDKN